MADQKEIAAARAMFPQMPQEVFERWLVKDGIEAYGWKFKSASERLTGTGYRNFFGFRSMKFWMTARWERVQLPFQRNIFHRESIARIDDIVGHCAYRRQTPTANILNTKDRFLACTRFVAANKALPFPVVATPTQKGLDILDGHHRLAAVSFLGLQNLLLDVWLGLDPS